jgi:hypothetical protein
MALAVGSDAFVLAGDLASHPTASVVQVSVGNALHDTQAVQGVWLSPVFHRDPVDATVRWLDYNLTVLEEFTLPRVAVADITPGWRGYAPM